MSGANIIISIVAYFNEAEVISFVDEHLMPQSYSNYQVKLVVNGSDDTSILQQHFADNKLVEVLLPEANLGYLGAARFAYNSLNEQPDLFVLCNTDMEIPDHSFLERLASKYIDTNYAIIGPSVISGKTGHDQNPIKKNRITAKNLKTRIQVFQQAIAYHTYHKVVKFKNWFKAGQKPGPAQEVYAVHGSFLIITKAYFNGGGNLDFKGFLYAEEYYLAEMCHKLSLSIFYDPDFQVIHHEHATTGDMSATKAGMLAESLQIIFDEFYQET